MEKPTTASFFVHSLLLGFLISDRVKVCPALLLVVEAFFVKKSVGALKKYVVVVSLYVGW